MKNKIALKEFFMIEGDLIVLRNNKRTRYKIENLVPARHNGNVIENYYVANDGTIFSYLWNRWHLKKPHMQKGYHPYPRLSIHIRGKSKTINVHRIICETFHGMPDSILTNDEWDQIPEKIRLKLQDCMEETKMQVNHIDHDRMNYHPSNLEWVTREENTKKYQEHRKNKA